MSDQSLQPFVRAELVPQRSAPVRTTGAWAWVRSRLLSSPTNILLTIVAAVLLWFAIVPTVKFLLVDAVWTGSDRNACLEETVGRTVGACWPFVQAKLQQFMYGFYPQSQLWRVNLVFALAILLLIPLLIPRIPGKTLNASLFFFALPVVAFFLLYGGGIKGFGISWLADLLQALADSIADGGRRLRATASAAGVPGLSQLLAGIGIAVALAGDAALLVLLPLTLTRDALQVSNQPVWYDFMLTAIIISALLFVLAGGFRSGWRALILCLITFAGIALVIAVMGLHHGGLPIVGTREWGGMLVTLVVSITGIVASMPIGIALALGRRSQIPLIRASSVAFIEFWRGVPLITVLFFATYMLPLFMPQGFNIDGMIRVLVGVALFSGAYNAEVIRGGLAAVPRGQAEAANALGLSYWKTTGLIVMPQALRHVIPGLVNSFIALFKDTTLVQIVAMFDLLGQLRASFADPNWATPTTLFTGFAFAGIIYFVVCFAMSRYSLFVEKRLNAHRRN
ncbi:amino acid ABC transporter permease [Afipia sp. P52-10]|jgi:general L-amino acid transport system permease protein|uniref:amino acid ABC transporter permease n=1 Tax=Afipia sp. P52-10 TaxID=1429916 RepID=UPI0003DF0204|nr:amino acid ABC transporter permease [Afipia sp. P52-10]ETR75099.1 amino acid ABC transporter permease [Afipia sp. P52-10]